MKIDTRAIRGFEVLTVVLTCLAVQVVFTLPAYGDEIVGWGLSNADGQATPPVGNDFTAIAAGGSHSLALKSDGSIVGWGRNDYVQATPPAGNDFTAIAAGSDHSLALKSDGSIVCWGRNFGDQAGNDFTAVAANYYHSLALKADSSIVGWGSNTWGESTPPAGNDFTAIAAGRYHGLALKLDGTIVGWGFNDYGQATPPVGNDFTAIAAYNMYSLALKSDGSIVGWGKNHTGQATPPVGNDFTAIAPGYNSGFALKSDGSIVGWGANFAGLMTPPVGNDFTAVAAGSQFSLALMSVLQNSPPDADPGGPYLAGVGSENSIILDGSGSYDSDGDPLNYSWIQDESLGIFTDPDDEQPIYTGIQGGITDLTLTVSDGIANDSDTTMIVVYDPEGGFVTGGGWIWSLPGSYIPDPTLEGKANFGFVSKYKKGATVQTGNTKFQFKAGDLNFHSSSYDWLVVTDSNYARFKGTGTINGYGGQYGDYKFMLWAGDDATDTFRIRIWEEDEATGDETDVYDNGFDQAIGGGSIVIHTK